MSTLPDHGNLLEIIEKILVKKRGDELEEHLNETNETLDSKTSLKEFSSNLLLCK